MTGGLRRCRRRFVGRNPAKLSMLDVQEKTPIHSRAGIDPIRKVFPESKLILTRYS